MAKETLSVKHLQWLALFTSPVLPSNFSESDLYGLATRGALVALADELENDPEDADALELLAQIILNAAGATQQKQALKTLTDAVQAGSAAGRDALFRLALQERHAASLDFIRAEALTHPNPEWQSACFFFLKNRARLLDIDPTLDHLTDFFLHAAPAVQHEMRILSASLLPNWGLSAAMLLDSETNAANAERIIKHYGDFSTAERRLLTGRLTASAGSKQSLIPRLYLHFDDVLLHDTSLKNRLEPPAAEERTIFYFLSGQWEKYEAADLDYRILKNAYQTATEPLRQRLIQAGLKSGHIDWLEAISDHIQADSTFTPNSFAEWESWISRIISQQDWQRLWQMLPGAPLALIPDAFSKLQQAGFQLAAAEERTFYEQLAAACEDFPPLLPVPFASEFYSPMEKPFTLEISADGHYLAAGFLNTGIQVWDLQRTHQPPLSLELDGIAPKSLTFSDGSGTLATAWSDNSVRIFRLSSGQFISRIQTGKSPIVSLFLSRDDRRIYILDQSGSLSAYGYPEGTPIYDLKLNCGMILRAIPAADKDVILIIDDRNDLTLFDLQRKQTIARISDFPQIQALTPDWQDQQLSCVTSGQQIAVWNLLSQRQTAGAIPQGLTGRIITACEIDAASTCAFGSQNGEAVILSLNTGRCLAELRGSSAFGMVPAIRVDHQRERLYLTDFNGTVSGWDLSLFSLATRVIRADSCPTPPSLKKLQDQYPSNPVRKLIRLANTVFDWRCRYDIEIFDEI